MDDSGRFCPIVGKVSLDPGEPLPIDSAEKHECLICFRYQENTNLLEQNSHSLRMKLYTFFRVFRHSTQPIHIIVMLITMAIAMLCMDMNNTFTESKIVVLINKYTECTLWPTIYLTFFSILFGSQMWMTFISGLVLLFILPRHTFACVQSALFPKYMSLHSFAAFGALISFIRIHYDNKTSNQEHYQTIGLAINCVLPLISRILVVPSLLQLIKVKLVLERAAGHKADRNGRQLTKETEKIIQACITYRNACTRFRHLHLIIAFVNIVTLAANVFHISYLASKISNKLR